MMTFDRRSIFRLIVCFAATSILTSKVDVAYALQKPIKVYVLAGQSNMQGHAHVRTLPHVGMDPTSAPMLAKIQNEDSTPKSLDNVWISYHSANGTKQGNLSTGFGADNNKIGPELMFGVTMSEALGEPILIIKVAWGGKSIHTDFRPPSAGPYEFSDAQLEQFQKQGKDVEEIKAQSAAATGRFYRQMVANVKSCLSEIDQIVPDQANGDYQIAGFVWFQGWNDMVDGGVYPNRGQPGGYDDYTKVLAHFVRDVRKDLDTPDLPFVVGVMGVGGSTEKYGPDQMRYKATHQIFRDAMAAVALQPEFKGNVINVLTENCWDLELSALSQRKSKIDSQVRALRRKGEQDQQAIEALRSKRMNDEFSDDEREILATGKSNAEFHYLGSSKIMLRIGEAFAKALIK